MGAQPRHGEETQRRADSEKDEGVAPAHQRHQPRDQVDGGQGEQETDGWAGSVLVIIIWIAAVMVLVVVSGGRP